MKILQRDNLPKGGFAGLTEHRLIKDPTTFGPDSNDDGSWSGLEKFIYLADARFMPHGETRMHSHHEVDVISVMVEGNIAHEGSLEHGKSLSGYDVQVQSAGGEGFSHNEVNPDDSWNRMLQLWVLPEQLGQPSDYKVYRPTKGEMTRIYGGKPNSNADFPAKTVIKIGLLNDGQQIEVNAPFIAYVVRGEAIANEKRLKEGDLIRGEALKFEAKEDVHLVVVHKEG